LRLHALFETLSAFMGGSGNGTGWKSWPAEYQRPDSAEVAEFAEAHADTIRFHMWLQWLAHLQLSEAAAVARDAGLRIGLYLDLAVGEAIDGSATWSERDATLPMPRSGARPIRSRRKARTGIWRLSSGSDRVGQRCRRIGGW
jgi:4-alpha-glucanotransferase